MALFTAKREDGRAEWRVVFDMVKPLAVGEIVTLDALCEELDRPRYGNLKPVYEAVGRAAGELRRHHHRSLGSVPTVGYKVLHPREHELQALEYHRGARRKLSTGLEVVRATDVGMLRSDERSRAVSLALVFHGLCRAVDELDLRQKRTEEIVARVEAQTNERFEEQERRLSRMTEAMRAAGLLTE